MLSIGINYVQSKHSKLTGCWNDVHELKRQVFPNIPTSEHIILTDENANIGTRQWPTRDNIFAAIATFTSRMVANKTYVFHYSGHGGQLPNRDPQSTDPEPDGLDECLFDANEQIIVDDELKQHLVKRVPAGARLFCLIDACHSSTSMDLRDGEGQSFIACISGCRDDQTSADTTWNNKPGGAITGLFIEMLTAPGSDSFLRHTTFKELVGNLDVGLSKRGYDQVPELTTNHDDMICNTIIGLWLLPLMSN